MLPPSLLLLCALVLGGLVRLLLVGRRPKGIPPGPPTVPVLGNLHQLPARDVHLQFEKWARQYGPIYSVMLGTKTLIVLSSDVAVKDLLDKKSNIYSDRVEAYIGQNIASGGYRLLMMEYGERWRIFRKVIHGLMNIAAAKNYVPYQMLENRQMLYDMLETPDQCLQHIRRYSNALTTAMVFGWRTSTYEDPKMKQLFEGFAQFNALNGTGTAALTDFFPWFRNLPDFLLPTRKKAKELHKHEKALYLSHWLTAKEATLNGTIKPCFCVGLVAAQKTAQFSDEQAAYISGTLLEAGSDTTSNTLYAFVQAMLLYPEVQKKAQEEIERVVGSERMPTMRDEPELQYIRACMKETLRWMPTTILGAAPHAVTQDDFYMGYRIPKGAGVMNNVWAIHMDPSRHPEPRKFNPDRYKDDLQSLADAAANSDPTKRDQFVFGAGRRICSGMHVAERSLFLGMSRIIWAFDISPQQDGQGKPILPDPDDLTQGFVVLPEEFPVSITPRSQARADMVRSEWQAAQDESLDPETKQWIKIPEDLQQNMPKIFLK